MLSAIISLFYTILVMASSGLHNFNTILPIVVSVISIIVVVYVGLFVLRAIAICKMAKKRKIKWWWVGMLPYVNYALIGKLAGPIRIFGMDIKNMGIVTAIVTALLDIFNTITTLVPYIATFIFLFDGGAAAEIVSFLGSVTAGTLYNFLNVFIYVVDIVFILSYFSLALAIFGKYAPQKRLLFTVLSLIQPLFNIFLFVIRNNKAYSNPDDYYREKMANRFGQTYNPYQNPYQTNENPFDDYGTNNKNDNENPFDEF